MRLIGQCQTFQLKNLGDNRGNMVVLESKIGIPFQINRLFYIYGADSQAVRGQHANKKSDFFMICLAGSCKIRLTDGKETSIVELDTPLKALYIPKMIWKEMYDFSEDSILLVLTNTHYSATEYIKDFEGYKSIMIAN